MVSVQFRAVRTFALFAALAFFAGPAAAADSGRRPNVIVIIADDVGYADFGFHGCKDIPTPHLDALAKGGVRCTDAYVSCPVCSPTRAGILTGRYQQRYGHEYNPSLGKDVGLPLIDRPRAKISESAAPGASWENRTRSLQLAT